MNAFILTRKNPECPARCCYPFCPERYLARLRGIPCLQRAPRLVGSLRQQQRHGLPRSGDVLIVFAASHDELSEYLAEQELFESCRVLLVLGDERLDSADIFQLCPRYVAYASDALEEIEAVAGRMLQGDQLQAGPARRRYAD